MWDIEAPKASVVRFGRRMSSPQPTREFGERHELPSGVRGRAPAKTHFGIFLGHKTLLADRKMHFCQSVMRKVNKFV